MADETYDTDITAWADHQTARLRRVIAGKRVEDVDWDQVIAEVEDVAHRKRDAVAVNLSLALEHLVKLRLRPGSVDDQTWRHAAVVHLRHARRHYQPGMRGRVDLAGILQDAAIAVAQDHQLPAGLPVFPVGLDELMDKTSNPYALVDALLQR